MIDAIGQWLRGDRRRMNGCQIVAAELERQQRAFSSETLDSIENTPFTAAEQREYRGEAR